MRSAPPERMRRAYPFARSLVWSLELAVFFGMLLAAELRVDWKWQLWLWGVLLATVLAAMISDD